MKLKNKKTGEIEEFEDITRVFKFIGNQNTYSSLAEFIEEWEDYKEPKQHWHIYGAEPLEIDEHNWDEDFIMELRSIGNYFNTKEEAEKAVEKLKAWKRLKDKGFRIALHGCKGNAWLEANWGNLQGDFSDVLLLFGGEE